MPHNLHKLSIYSTIILLFTICTLSLTIKAASALNDELTDIRVVSFPFNSSIQIVFKQYYNLIEVYWIDQKADHDGPLTLLYSVTIEHRGVRYPGVLNKLYQEYNIILIDNSEHSSYRLFLRNDSDTIRPNLINALTQLKTLYSYPENAIISASIGIVIYLYELPGVIPRLNLVDK